MLEVGEVLDGKYRIVRLLGEGGMGAVYEGENTLIHRRVAIKVLHTSAAADPSIVQRFEREAQAAGRIGSEHVVEVLDLGTMPSGDRYMVMEFLDGQPLTDRIKARSGMNYGETYAIMRQILEGLRAAHEAGVIHRDLKPDNVFLLRSRAGLADFAKLLDFGISKFATGGMRMTQTGAVMGTPYYLSPEQAKGSKETDHRTDLYAAGVILYECATGNVPYDAANFNELLFKIVLEPPTPVTTYRPDIEPEFAELISKALARSADDRFQSAVDFRNALDAWAQAHSDLLGDIDVHAVAGMRSHDGSTDPNLMSDLTGAHQALRGMGTNPNTAAASSMVLGSGTNPPTGAQKPASPLLWIGIAAAVLLIGGAAGAYGVVSSSAAAAAQQKKAEELAEARKKADDEKDKELAAARKEAEAARAKAREAEEEAAKAAREAAKKKAAAALASASTAEKQAAEEAQAKAEAARKVAERARAAHTAAKRAPAPAPAPKPASTGKIGGRTVRTSLD